MPGLVRRIAAAGHTIAHHTWTHPHLSTICRPPTQWRRSTAASPPTRPLCIARPAPRASTTPFFRFPYFESTPALLDALDSRGIVVFGADLWASDWQAMTPEMQLKLITDRLRRPARASSCFTTPGRKPLK